MFDLQTFFPDNALLNDGTVVSFGTDSMTVKHPHGYFFDIPIEVVENSIKISLDEFNFDSTIIDLFTNKEVWLEELGCFIRKVYESETHLKISALGKVYQFLIRLVAKQKGIFKGKRIFSTEECFVNHDCAFAFKVLNNEDSASDSHPIGINLNGTCLELYSLHENIHVDLSDPASEKLITKYLGRQILRGDDHFGFKCTSLEVQYSEDSNKVVGCSVYIATRQKDGTYAQTQAYHCYCFGYDGVDERFDAIVAKYEISETTQFPINFSFDSHMTFPKERLSYQNGPLFLEVTKDLI
jgi:hypothetical protein